MRWMALKEGYQKKMMWLNIDHLTSVKFAVGADGQPMAYMLVSNGAEVTTHDPEDLERLHKILQKNAC